MSERLNTELWVDEVDGKHVQTHEGNGDCVEHGCCLHNPSPHHMVDWPLHWREDRGIMERICEHGVGHPDPDAIAYSLRRSTATGEKFDLGQGIHGCDGCCREPAIVA